MIKYIPFEPPGDDPMETLAGEYYCYPLYALVYNSLAMIRNKCWVGGCSNSIQQGARAE